MAARFLALGDSYTVGEGVDDVACWPALICARLDAVELVRVAKTSWTVGELDRALDLARPRGAFDVVSLLIGVNDQYRGGAPEAYAPSFRAMLRRAAGFARGEPSRVMVLSIPDYGFTPHGARERARIGAELDAFNRVSRAAARELGAHYIDITTCSRQDRPGWIAADGLHPSATQHAVCAQRIAPVFDAIVARRPRVEAGLAASAALTGHRPPA